MVNRTDQNISRDARSRRETNIISANTSSRSFGQPLRSIDDVIASLANAPENRRARQVTEWERMRRQIFRQAA